MVGYLDGPSLITEVLKSEEWLWSERDVSTEEWSERCSFAGFEVGRKGPCCHECGWALEVEKGEELDSPLESLERNVALLRN